MKFEKNSKILSDLYGTFSFQIVRCKVKDTKTNLHLFLEN